MPNRLARKPSTASLAPAAKNNKKATRISPEVIAQITTGTSKMRARVMRLGMLTRFGAPARLSPLFEYSHHRAVAQSTIPKYGMPHTETSEGSMADKGLTYAEAGVDIDAGNRMVELIKPLVRSTARPGADAVIGGFGGLFDLKRAGFVDPVLVGRTDGVGTKLKIAIEPGAHETIGIDLVAMSVNDLVVQGPEPLLFLDYYACGKLSPEIGARVVKGIAAGCRMAGCALIGGE